jgi:hypothetical protein
MIKQTGLEWLSNNSDYLVQYILAAIYIIQVVIVRLIVIICPNEKPRNNTNE